MLAPGVVPTLDFPCPAPLWHGAARHTWPRWIRAPGVPGSVPAASLWDDVTPATVASEGSGLPEPILGLTWPVGQGPVPILALLGPHAPLQPPPAPSPLRRDFGKGRMAITATR